MASTHQSATVQQQRQYSVPGSAFDDAEFDALQTFRSAEVRQATMVAAAPVTPVQTVPAATVFAGMTAKLTTWRFAEDSWRTDDEE